MTPIALVTALAARGVQLMPDGDGLVARPASKLTDADRQAIRAHKSTLIRLLTTNQLPCRHIQDPALRDFYTAHPELTCVRCFLDGAPLASTDSATNTPVPTLDVDAGNLAAVKLRATVIGDVWLVADDDALADNLDIIRSGLPVFFFDEIAQLRGKTPTELKAIAMIKTEFPTSRVLQ
jgi:hypothetical protein